MELLAAIVTIIAWTFSIISLVSKTWVQGSFSVDNSFTLPSFSTSPIWFSAMNGNIDILGVVIPAFAYTSNDITDDACSSTLRLMDDGAAYEYFGAYGFCTKEDGKFQYPPHALAIFLLAIFAVLFLTPAAIYNIAMATPWAGPTNKVLRLISAVCFVIGGILLIAQFAVALTWDYYSGLMSGKSGILLPNIEESISSFSSENRTAYVVGILNDNVHYGLGFAAAIIGAFFSLVAATLQLIIKTSEPTPETEHVDGKATAGAFESPAEV